MSVKRKDEEIKMDIVDQLYWNDRVDASRVSVEVTDGEVTLSGRVPSYSARRAARDDAFSIPGVSIVHDRLRVEYPEGDGVPSDNVIRSNIENALQWDNDIDATEIKVEVEGGHAILQGTVNAYWKKMWVEDLVTGLRGVTGLTNKLTVVPTHNIIDEKVSENIVAAIDRSGKVNIDNIDVRVENGIVTLTGTVPNWAAYEAVNKAALYTAGVIDVKNDLSIE
jgi:hyperosmotically inducible protein